MIGTITTAQAVGLAVSTLLPILVSLVTARAAESSTKALVLLALAAVSGLLTQWLAALEVGAAFDWSQAALTVLSGYIVAVASHFGLWKPTGVTGSVGVVAARVPGGIGG
ncbi:MAG: hypothetical protein ACRCZP_09185 [Phycicoccus sp.]